MRVLCSQVVVPEQEGQAYAYILEPPMPRLRGRLVRRRDDGQSIGGWDVLCKGRAYPVNMKATLKHDGTPWPKGCPPLEVR
jgi:hypothetical protein